MDINTPATLDDYQVTLELPTFDAKWETEIAARSLLYCPGNDAELGCWQEWYTPQLEAIRLTPLLFQQLKEHEIIGRIRLRLEEHPISIFENFFCCYILKDRHLDMLDRERRLYAEGQKDWRLLYHEIKELFHPTSSTVVIVCYLSQTPDCNFESGLRRWRTLKNV